MYDTSVRGGCIDDTAATCTDADVTGYDDDVAGLQLVVGYTTESSRITPSGGGHVGYTDACLVETPVDEAGAVEAVRSLGAPYIRAADLRRRDGYQCACGSGDGRSAADIAAHGTAAVILTAVTLITRRAAVVPVRAARAVLRLRLRLAAVEHVHGLCTGRTILAESVYLLEACDGVLRHFAIVAGDVALIEVAVLCKVLLQVLDGIGLLTETHRKWHRIRILEGGSGIRAKVAVDDLIVSCLEGLDRGLCSLSEITVRFPAEIAEIDKVLLVLLYEVGLLTESDDVCLDFI